MSEMKYGSVGKQLIILLICIILVLFVTGYLSFELTSRTLERKTVESQEQIMYQIEGNVNALMERTGAIMNSLVFNRVLQEYLKEEDIYIKNKDLLPRFENLLQNHISLSKSIMDIGIFDKDNNLTNYNGGIYQQMKSIRATIKGSKGISQVSYVDKTYIYAVLEPIYDYDAFKTLIGSCMFIINTSDLIKVVKNTSSSSYTEFYIIDDKGTLIIGPDMSGAGKKLESKFLSSVPTDKRSSLVNNDGKKYMVLSQEIKAQHWKIISVISLDVLLHDLVQARTLSFSLWIVMIVIITIIYMLQLRNITDSVSHLLSHMKIVEKGNFDIKTNFPYNNEFKMLAEGFDRMMGKIVTLTQGNMDFQKKLFEEELNNRQAKLIALQSQINPHFLYNTLECINSMGAYYKAVEIQQMATSLAHIFRYAIKGENLVKISDETDSIRHYLKIQQLRFPDKFEIQFNLAPEAMDLYMLKFILQPIIENAIFHGLEPMEEEGRLAISLMLNNENIQFIIEDNGIGMDQSTLDLLIGNLTNTAIIKTGNEKNSRSIGLININNRIKLYYGPEYGLEIFSRPQEGTTVIVKIPVMNREAENV